MDGFIDRGLRPHAERSRRIRGATRHRLWAAIVLLAILVSPRLSTIARRALATTPAQDTLIQVLFGDLPPTDGVDANGDGALTVADLLVYGPPSTPTPTPTPVGLLFAGTVSDLLPHAPGDQLTYRITDPLGKVTTETTNVISEDGQGGFVVDDQIASGQQVQSHQAQSYTDTGSQLLFNGFTDLFFSPQTRTTCSPPLLRLTTPLVADQMFSTSVQCDVRFVDSGLFIGFVNRTDTFTPKEIMDSLTVPAGTFTSVVHISGSTNQSGQLESDEIYIAPGVGAILQLASFSGQIYKHELISGTIDGHPVAP